LLIEGQEEFESQKGGITCISWNPSPLDTHHMLLVGSNDPNVKLWEYNDTYRKWVHVETLVGHR
jgi:WD40 repeat protein